MFYISSWYALENPTFLLCRVYYHGRVYGAVRFYMNLTWTWHSYCQAIGKQHLWMANAAVQTVPGVPGQHRGTCLLSSRIHRGNSSGFHHCPLFYALYSTSQEIRGRYYFLTKISVIWLQLAASASLCTPNVGFGLMSPCQECVLYWHRVIWFLSQKGYPTIACWKHQWQNCFHPPLWVRTITLPGAWRALRADSRYMPAAAISTIDIGKKTRAILHH